MLLNDEQKKIVEGWAAEGAGISEIQSKLASEMDIRLSYMDTRLMLMSAGISIRDKPDTGDKNLSGDDSPAKREEEFSDAASADAPPVGDDDGALSEETAPAEPDDSGDVTVSLSRIERPGFMISGSVVFSDGISAEWGITNDGRISLVPSVEGYKPSTADLRKFQVRLQEAMYGKGY